MRNAYIGIDDVTVENPGYNVLSLLKQARSKFFQVSHGARKNVPKSLFFFNDGRTGIAEEDLKEESDKLRDMGVKIVVLGVTDKVNPDKLKTISTSRDSYFFAEDLPQVILNVDRVARQLQPGTFLCFLIFHILKSELFAFVDTL